MKFLRAIFSLAAVVLAGGCTLAPKYARPDLAVPEQFPAGAAGAETNAAPAAAELAWPEFFADANLRQIVALAAANNRDLRLAVLNVERARALYGVQRGALYPTVQATAAGNRAGVPADLSSSGSRLTSERYDVNLGAAAWEIDLFGRIRSLKDRALQEYLGTEQARRGAQILLVSAVANAYLALAADRESQALAQTTLAAQQDSCGLIRRRNELGLLPDVDLYRAQSQVESARRDVARFAQRAALDRNALDLLVGAPVPEELLPANWAAVVPPRAVSAGLPSEVLLRRPDVLQAESQLKAAHADVGAARAALFPRISLTAAFGTASGELSGLFQSGSDAWTFAPAATLPIFDTRSWSALKVTRVQREIAVTQYEKTLQGAFREVADALAVRETVGQQVAAQDALVQAVAETYRLSQSRYDKGLDSYLGVLDAQRSLFAAQQALVLLKLEQLANAVKLYAALGGGGDPPAESAPAAP